MSREPELYKDKIEVSLDGRQIFYLFFGGAVIVGLVFVLGVMVGRRVEARGHVGRAHVEAAVDPLAALDRLEGGSGLSFQGALRGAPVAKTPVEQEIEGGQGGQGGLQASGSRLQADEKKGDDKKVAAKKADDKKADDKQADDKKADDKKADDKKPDKPDKADKVAAKGADDAKQDDPPKKVRFTLQLSSFQDRAEAEAFADTIRAAGYEPHVSQGDVDGKQFYRVRVGSYRTLEAANDAKSDFEKAAKKSALVVKL